MTPALSDSSVGPGLQVFAFCSRATQQQHYGNTSSSSTQAAGGSSAGVALLLVNPSSVNHSVQLDLGSVRFEPGAIAEPKRLVWELTQGATPASVLLNGQPLVVTKKNSGRGGAGGGGGGGSWKMPPMDPRTESDATSPLAVAAQSYSFVVLPTVTAPACAAAAAHGEEADR